MYIFPVVLYLLLDIFYIFVLNFIFSFQHIHIQDRVTDHRIGFTVNGVDRVVSGENLSSLTDALGEYDEKEKLGNFLQKISELR